MHFVTIYLYKKNLKLFILYWAKENFKSRRSKHRIYDQKLIHKSWLSYWLNPGQITYFSFQTYIHLCKTGTITTMFLHSLITPQLCGLKAWTGAWHRAAALWMGFSAIENHLNADVIKSVNEGRVGPYLAYFWQLIMETPFQSTQIRPASPFKGLYSEHGSTHCNQRFKWQYRSPQTVGDQGSKHLSLAIQSWFCHWEKFGSTKRKLILLI